MPALDTNVLIRFLVRDDAAQLAAARRLIRRYVAEGQALFVPVTVFLELEWVLRSCFGFDKNEVTWTLAQLLSATELEFESETAVELALARFCESNADFSDCVHIGLATQAGALPLWTFDMAASRVDGARLLAV